MSEVNVKDFQEKSENERSDTSKENRENVVNVFAFAS